MHTDQDRTVPTPAVPHARPAPPTPLRIAVVGPDEGSRQALVDTVAAAPDLVVVAWADSAESLLALGTRADVCLAPAGLPVDQLDALRAHGNVVARAGVDAVAAARAAAGAGAPSPAIRRPRLAPRQRDVLVAFVSGSDLVPTVARKLGMDHETVKTHLRRIRAKYAQVGRPASTRRDLYVRAVEDGLLDPPSGHRRS